MSISAINNSTPTIKQPAFKGKWDRTEHGNPYYKANNGAFAGSIVAIPAGLTWLNRLRLKVLTDEQIKQEVEKLNNPKDKETASLIDQTFKMMGFKGTQEEMFINTNNSLKKQKKYAIPFALTAAGISVGCGLLVDHLRNKKAQETADLVKRTSKKHVLMTDDKTTLSNNGQIIYKSNIGSKYGALLGTGCGLVASFMAKNKAIGQTTNILSHVIPFAIGGWLMGLITDSTTNSSAKKNG